MSIVRQDTISGKGLFEARFAKLAKAGVSVFHINDLASLWQIQNPRNLHVTLSRYAKKGLLYRIYRGLYSLKPVEQIDSWLLGMKVLHQYAYVSAETVLAEAGIIQQAVEQITLVSSESRQLSLGGHDYRVRQLADRFLFQPNGIIEIDGMRVAIAERAVADILYFDPQYYFDFEKGIDWKKVLALQKSIGYPLTHNRYK